MDILNCMKTFVAVVEAESFTAAGARLDISKALVSKYVGILEDHLGTRLLNRTTRRLSLTESGLAYYERCLQILADVDEAEQVAAQSAAMPRGTLKVAMPVSFGTVRIAPLLTEYMRRYPEVRLDIALADRRVDLIEDGYDLAIRVGNLPESGLIARKLATDRIVLCASPAYLQVHGAPQTPEDLKQHACLNYSYSSSGDEWVFGKGKTRAAVRVDGPMRANNGDMLRLAALDGAGLIWQPHFIVADDVQAGRLVELMKDESDTELGIYAIYPSRKHLSAKVRTFVDYLVACMA
ncbi:Putative transcriptional regulator LysR family [Herminiimonas arsenicoxydans]|uniref:Transcriptional regulator LysR family n=1 Tax=Herminiimonas arsenicoxydans TaxID=204773 RepID=A4G7H3_HERAR|nr:Putative transcriptional regulator LysR family [Herminiimonas arsenicoxydans]